MSAESAIVLSNEVDLSDQSLCVKIRDCSFQDGNFKFVIDTKTSLPGFVRHEFSVSRQHEEFIWLYDCLKESEHYAGYIIPPAPAKPDLGAYREKLQKLNRDESNMTKEENSKLREEAKEDYIALFRKIRAMHNIFLQRLVNHPVFKNDNNVRKFLEYDGAVSIRGKNKVGKIAGLFSNISNSADELLLSNSRKDIDEFFEHETKFLSEYYTNISDCTMKSDSMIRNHKKLFDIYMKISSDLSQLAIVDESELSTVFGTVSEKLDKAREIERRLVSDEDLRLFDTLRYCMAETAASKALLNRRQKYFSLYVAANRSLVKATSKNKDIPVAENNQQEACHKFEAISSQAKQELQDVKTTKISAYGKNLVGLAELELNHAKAQIELLRHSLMSLHEEH